MNASLTSALRALRPAAVPAAILAVTTLACWLLPPLPESLAGHMGRRAQRGKLPDAGVKPDRLGE